ncbi:MAG: hypothetical protein ACYDC3_15995 [Candidatus Binataceae bacterium]
MRGYGFQDAGGRISFVGASAGDLAADGGLREIVGWRAARRVALESESGHIRRSVGRERTNQVKQSMRLAQAQVLEDAMAAAVSKEGAPRTESNPDQALPAPTPAGAARK